MVAIKRIIGVLIMVLGGAIVVLGFASSSFMAGVLGALIFLGGLAAVVGERMRDVLRDLFTGINV